MNAISSVLAWFDRLAPRSLAESWDNTGLLVGDRSALVERIMICLTVTPESAVEAIERRASLIVSHHPVLFRPVHRLTADDPQGRMLLDLIRAGVSVYSPHTAFDSACDGINAEIARGLGLTNIAPLRPTARSPAAKLVVFLPLNDLDRVARAMFDAGAGVIGEYHDCSFRVRGTGTFHGSAASNPTIGHAGRFEEVDEWRLEVLCPQECVGQVVAAMRRAHSYEEPAYDVYPLSAEPSTAGGGRRGEVAKSVPLREFALTVQQLLASRAVEVVGRPDATISRVGVACGSGGEFIGEARAAGCDAFITGEARFHTLLDAESAGPALIVAGHYATERFGVELLARRCAAQFPALEVWASHREHDPAWSLT